MAVFGFGLVFFFERERAPVAVFLFWFSFFVLREHQWLFLVLV